MYVCCYILRGWNVCMLLYTEGVGMYVCCYKLRGGMYVCCYVLRG